MHTKLSGESVLTIVLRGNAFEYSDEVRIVADLHSETIF